MARSAIKIHGLEQLERTLRSLPRKVGRRAVLAGLRQGAKPMVNEAKRLVPVETGELRNSLKALTDRKVRGDLEAVVRVGPTKGRGIDGWYGHLVEFGTTRHRIRAKRGGALRLHGGALVKRVSHPGAPARPFLRPAFDQTQAEVEERTVKFLARAIERAAAREAAKALKRR